MKTAQHWIDTYQLLPHPEGGYFRETYRSGLDLPASALAGFEGARQCSTAIYFLLKAGQKSRLHRIRSDEVWHFYAGTRLAVHLLDSSGHRVLHLGPDDGFQGVVPAGTWFGARPLPSVSQPEAPVYALVGCTVAPGFDFDDFEFAQKEPLEAQFGPLPPDILSLL